VAFKLHWPQCVLSTIYTHRWDFILSNTTDLVFHAIDNGDNVIGELTIYGIEKDKSPGVSLQGRDR
jgi:hypothetical protein